MTNEDGVVLVDGSFGEGGGQVLRTALTLSVTTGKPLHITNIRANRSKPGLRPQHLKAVDAARTISKAEVAGATLGANELYFKPGSLHSGRYNFNIGTAGSTSLVLQTIFYPLSLLDAASTVTITGGTHVRWSPCYHYLDLQWLPFLLDMGFDAKLELLTAGFYPKGGGKIMATVRQASKLTPRNMDHCGALLEISGISAVANLKLSIADRQKRKAINGLKGLEWKEGRPNLRIKRVNMPSRFKGTVLILMAKFEMGRACYFSLGEIGKPAEHVAEEVVTALKQFVTTGAAVDQYLADQLLIPLSLAQGVSEISTNQITKHLLTNAHIVQLFSPVQIDIQGDLGAPGLVRVCQV
jgi:RNA 3'-terminal phosphate cyclase (ATP)